MGQMLTSGALGGWNFGNLRQRLGSELWERIVARRILPDALGSAFMVGLVMLAGAACRGRDAVAAILGAVAFLTPLLLFTNLHIVHNYYQYANTAFLLVAIAIGLGSVATFGRAPVLAAVCLGVVLVSQIEHFHRHQLSWIRQNNETFAPYQIAIVAREALQANGSLIVLGDDWSSTVPYYSRLKSLVLPHWTPPAVLQTALSDPQARLAGTQFAGVVHCTSGRDYGPAGQPIVDAFVAGRSVLAERGPCRLLAAER